jgi:hypothetical protein
MSNISKSQLDAVDTRVEVMLRKLFEGRTVNFEDINGVDILNADDDDTLFYNFTANLWENHPLKTINGESLKGPGNILVGSGGGSGTVTSVALTAPTQFTVSGSPVTTNGTLGFAWNNQVANRVLAGPTTGADAAPTFRALVADDIPGLPPDQIRNNTEERLLGWGEVVSGDGNGTLITLGTGFEWDGDQLNLTTNLQGWSGVATGAKQDTLVSGTNIRTVNGNTLLGSSDLVIATGATTLDGLSDVTITSVANGQVLTYDSGTSQWINATPSGGGGGLTNFTESVNTSAPNATIPAVQLLAANAASSVDVVISWKGSSGAFMVQVPDNTTAGGNKRGSGAIDFQSSRANANQVASGTRAFIGGGSNNRNTATNGFVGAGTGNDISGGAGNAIVAGQNNINSSSTGGIVAGLSNNLSGANAFCGAGVSNIISGSRAFVGAGVQNAADGESSWIPGGVQASTRGLFSAYAWSGALRSTNYDNQCIGITVQGSTSNATPAILTATRGAAGSTNVMVLPNNSCWTGTVHITGRSSGADVYYLRLDVVGARGANAAATTVKATNPAYTFTDTGLVGVSAQVIANTTRGSLEVEVTGLAATVIDWFAHFDAGNQIVR